MYDYLVVGSGLFGCTFARIAAEHNNHVLVIDKRSHIGGNCYSEKIEGINVHKYGPHCFHTNDEEVWSFLNRFTTFNTFTCHTKVKYGDRLFSFPINLMTLHELWGVATPAQAIAKLNSVKARIPNPANLEEWILAEVGEEIYETFIKGYTTKQWGRHPSQLPASIIRRLPIRLTYDDRYFDDKYQGIPTNGYTNMFENMLDHKYIDFEAGVDFFQVRESLMKSARKVVYTGKLDELYGFQYGELEYRSLRFDTKVLDGDYQGNAIINHTHVEVPYTRVVEHKHFEFKKTAKTVVTWEYPQKHEQSSIPCYPIKDQHNTELVARYMALNDCNKFILGGRLATYQYYDMHQVVAQALKTAKKFVEWQEPEFDKLPWRRLPATR
jgi:UDP-galactopyranose mutase